MSSWWNQEKKILHAHFLTSTYTPNLNSDQWPWSCRHRPCPAQWGIFQSREQVDTSQGRRFSRLAHKQGCSPRPTLAQANPRPEPHAHWATGCGAILMHGSGVHLERVSWLWSRAWLERLQVPSGSTDITPVVWDRLQGNRALWKRSWWAAEWMCNGMCNSGRQSLQFSHAM